MVEGKFLGIGYKVIRDKITFTVGTSAQVLLRGRGKMREAVT